MVLKITKNYPWARLYDEARGRLEKTTSPARKERLTWILIFSFATIILLIGVWGVYNRVSQLRRQANIAAITSRTQFAQTSTAQAVFSFDETATARAFLLVAKPSRTPEAVTDGAINSQEGSGASETETALNLENTPIVVSCEDFTGFPIEIVSGPELSPRPGYVYIEGLPEPIIQASWTIKNIGNCAWNQINLTDSVTGEVIVPILYKDGSKLDLFTTENSLQSGDEVSLVLSFLPKNALNVDRDWIIQVNGISLFDQPHIVLKVQDWVILSQVSPTPTLGIRPTSIPRTSTPGGNPSRPTPTKPGRNTPIPPTRGP
jgi:hypothetical protein